MNTDTLWATRGLPAWALRIVWGFSALPDEAERLALGLPATDWSRDATVPGRISVF